MWRIYKYTDASHKSYVLVDTYVGDKVKGRKYSNQDLYLAVRFGESQM